MAAAELQEQYASAPGNWLAQEIRRFQEQSTGLFPTPKPGDEKVRYNTIYGIDYTPLGQEAYKVDTPTLLKRPTGMKKETPFSLEQARRFNTWKVRKDLVDVDRVQQKVAERRRTALEAANRKQDDKLNLPTIQRGHTVAAEVRGEPSLHMPSVSRARPAVAQSICGSVRGERNIDTRQSLPAATSEGRYKDIKKDLLDAADDYMQKNPQSDRRVIDKALRSSTLPYRGEDGMMKTELPNTKQEVTKWLEQATDEEQQMALQFFRSVGGMRLMGMGGKKEHKDRLSNLLTTLENGEAGAPLPRLSYAEEQKRRERKQRNLQFVRLLSPTTLNTKQELQSWHHLPMYRPHNRADNVRSHYTQPQKVRPLHFTIHPDWGP